MGRAVVIVLVSLFMAMAFAVADTATAPGAPRKSKLAADEAQLMGLISADAAVQEIREIIRFGERSVGSLAEQGAQDYVAGRFESFGLEVIRHRFNSMTWDEKPGRFLEVRGSKTTLSPAVVTYGLNLGVWGLLNGNPYSFGNRDGGRVLEAELVDAGLGTAEDYAGLDVAGKVVFIRRDDFVTFWPTMPVIEAGLHGARAAVFYGYAGTWTLDEGIKQDAVGGPIPAFSISRTDALGIKDLLAAGPVRVRVSTNVDMTDHDVPGSESQNVIGILAGSGPRADEYILLSGHIDSWHEGAEDDASGVAAVIEAARALTTARREGWYTPDRTIIFLSVGAEELGAAIDSWFDWAIGAYNFYKDRQDVMRRAVATVNNDGVSFLGDTATLGNTMEIGGFGNAIIRDLGLSDRIHLAFGQSSFIDGWIYGPVAGGSTLNLFDNPGYISTIYHTQLDDITAINPAKLRWAAQINALTAYRLSKALFYPIDVEDLVDWALGDSARDRATMGTPELDRDFAASDAALAALKEAYLGLETRIRALTSEYDARGTSAVRREAIRLEADRINEALREARYAVSRFLWGTGTTLGGWIGIYRTEQHANDLHHVNEALASLRVGRLRDTLRAMEDVWFLDWAHKFSKATHDEVAADHTIGVTDPVILQWGAEWGQQQEYVFLYDAYVALRQAVEDRTGAPATTEAALLAARSDLIGFVEEDLENIRIQATLAASLLAAA
ncbi:MAG: M28 family peptidase [Methanobacteriota archaeon]